MFLEKIHGHHTSDLRTYINCGAGGSVNGARLHSFWNFRCERLTSFFFSSSKDIIREPCHEEGGAASGDPQNIIEKSLTSYNLTR